MDTARDPGNQITRTLALNRELNTSKGWIRLSFKDWTAIISDGLIHVAAAVAAGVTIQQEG